jgi:hypothetical protein
LPGFNGTLGFEGERALRLTELMPPSCGAFDGLILTVFGEKAFRWGVWVSLLETRWSHVEALLQVVIRFTFASYTYLSIDPSPRPNMNRRFLGLVLLATALSSGISLKAAPDTNAIPTKPTAPATAPKKAEKSEKKAKEGAPYPFHGTVASTDKKAVTVTLEGKEHSRVIHLNAESHIEKAGKPATLADLVAGDYLHGRVEKKNGQEYLLKATAGVKPEKKAEKTEKKAESTPAKKKTADQ